jgi:hypothetical protein
VTAVKPLQRHVTPVTQYRSPSIARPRRREVSHFGDVEDVPDHFLRVRRYADVIPEHPYLIIATHPPVLEIRRINSNRRSLYLRPALDFHALLFFQSKTWIFSSCSMLSKLDRTPSSRADLKCKIRRIRTGVDMIDDRLPVCIHWSPYFTVIVSQLFHVLQDRTFRHSPYQ